MSPAQKSIIGGFAFIIILIGCLIYVISNLEIKNNKSTKQDNGSRIGACSAAELFVEQNLKAPSTADFPACMNQKISYLGNKIWLVNSYVDSQNSFGAMIRTYYTVKVQCAGEDKWKLLDINFKD